MRTAIASLISFVLPLTAWAQLGGLDTTAGQIGYQRGSASAMIPAVVGTVISALLALVGLVFMVLIVIGGYHILNSGGSEEGYKKGRDEIKNGIIGLVVVFSAYAIAYFIMKIVAKESMMIL